MTNNNNNKENTNESFIQSLFSERIGGNNFGKGTVLYKFEKIKRAKREAMKNHPDVELIDMGVGEPDEMADLNAINVLFEEAKKPENRGYADNGIDEFKHAAVGYLKNVFGVSDLSIANVNHAIGSKPALAMFPSAFINPGDVVLMTTPGYPVMATHTKWLGGRVVNLPLLEENNFLPDLDSISDEDKTRAKLLYLNYPNNPTGAVATKEFYEKVVKFAKENNVIVVSDAAYAGLVFEDNYLSFLSVPGAIDVGVEIHSLSKAYNMTGWRIAFVAGNELLVKAFASVKDNNDSGQFIPIQKAGIYCLNHPEITSKISEKYSRRHEMLVSVLNEVGLQAKKPKGSFYLYVKCPKSVRFLASGDGDVAGSKVACGGEQLTNSEKQMANSQQPIANNQQPKILFETAEDFSQWLIKEKLISTVPWDDAGSYVRFSVTFQAKGESEEKRVIEEIQKRLGNVEFEF